MKYFKLVDDSGNTTSVESYSHNLAPSYPAIEIDNSEFSAFISSLPAPPPDPYSLRAKELLANPPTAITMPQVWELLRIIGRKFGWYG